MTNKPVQQQTYKHFSLITPTYFTYPNGNKQAISRLDIYLHMKLNNTTTRQHVRMESTGTNVENILRAAFSKSGAQSAAWVQFAKK